ncbi:unnamed protein product [Boreogadus saida]
MCPCTAWGSGRSLTTSTGRIHLVTGVFCVRRSPQEGHHRMMDFYPWIQNQHFSYFKLTELYHHFSLCRELLQVPSSCQLKGEDLGTFCVVRVDHLLHMALRRDPGQRARYHAHYAFIKAFQLPVGSSIMAACRLTYDSGSYVLQILGRRGQMSSHTSGWYLNGNVPLKFKNQFFKVVLAKRQQKRQQEAKELSVVGAQRPPGDGMRRGRRCGGKGCCRNLGQRSSATLQWYL